MKKSIILLLLIAALVATLCACKSDDEPENGAGGTAEQPGTSSPEVPRGEAPMFTREDFPRMDGSTSTVPLAQAAASLLLGETRESVSDLVSFNRTTQSFRNLAAGLCDILIVAEPSPDVLDELEAQGFMIEMSSIASEALVFVVNASNPVENLTTEQIQDIYTGKITNWRDVGGNDIEVVPYQRNADAGSQVLMEKAVMGGLEMAPAPGQSAVMAGSMGELMEYIKGFDGSANALGYTMYYYAEEMRMAEGLKILSVDGIKPGDDTIGSGSYPFLNSYFTAISAEEPEGSPARIMYNWLLSDDGQALIAGEGYVSVREIAPDSPSVSAPQTTYSRLRSGPLPELEPSDDYGTLLRYAGEVATFQWRGMSPIKYGLVTQDGMVVTDAAFDNINRATVYNPFYEPIYQSAYTLSVYNQQELYSGYPVGSVAVCALDGSWITPDDYVSVTYFVDAFVLVRDYQTFDIDVYDYGGKLLYNMKDKSWVEDTDPQARYLITDNDQEGYVKVMMADGTVGFVCLLTGECRRTDFAGATGFAEGLAAVCIFDEATGQFVYGYINTDFETVIDFKYGWAGDFKNGRAVVMLPMSDAWQSYQIINKRGEALHSVDKGYIQQDYDNGGFTVIKYDDTYENYHFDKDLNPIHTYTRYGIFSSSYYIGDGWYCGMFDNSQRMVLFDGEQEYLFDTNLSIYQIKGGFMSYTKEMVDAAGDSWWNQRGIMTIDGREIVPLTQDADIQIYQNEYGDIMFLMNISEGLSDNDADGNNIKNSYKLINAEGQTISSGPGIINIDEFGNACIISDDYYTYLAMDGKVIFRIPLMSYMVD